MKVKTTDCMRRVQTPLLQGEKNGLNPETNISPKQPNPVRSAVRLGDYKADEKHAAYILLIPAFVGLTFLTYGPLLEVFTLSFFNMRAGGMPSFIGL